MTDDVPQIDGTVTSTRPGRPEGTVTFISELLTGSQLGAGVFPK